jgi:formate/nitrite transporter FocA (FNT family)
MLKKITDGIAAGLMIVIGCAVYLACESKVVGAVLFAVALLTICFKGFSLFTGKVGYLPESHKKEDVSTLLLGLLGNAIATCGIGYLLGLAMPALKQMAIISYNAKLTQEWYQTLVRAIFCGVLMYVAVSIYKENKSLAGIFFAVPTFILSGFEHSIANMGYFGISGQVSAKAFLFIVIVIVGNAIGGVLLPLITGKLKIDEKQNKEEVIKF